ncbi:MAG: hypothetical protein AB1467_02265 [Candidatus Diapherotrites archaeon]
MSPKEMRKEFKIWLNSLGKPNLKEITSYADELTQKSLIKKEKVIKQVFKWLFHDFCAARNEGKQLKINQTILREITKKSFNMADMALWEGHLGSKNIKGSTKAKKRKLRLRRIV